MTVPYIFANASGQIPLNELDANFANVKAFATTAGSVTNNVQSNITSVGTLTSLNVSGNITGNTFIGNGALLTGITVTTSYGNANVANYLPTFSGILNANTVSATGTVGGGNIRTSGQVTAVGNIVGGNIRSLGVVSATGNIIGSYFQGNASLMTGLPVPYSNSYVASYLPYYTGDLNPGSANFTGTISTVGNVIAGIVTAGTISATGNVLGTYVLGNGSQLTGITANYNNSNVAAYLPNYNGVIAASTISASGNITGSYILGNGSQLSGLPATYSNANVSSYLPTYSGALSGSLLSITGDITAANVNLVGTVIAGGNLTGCSISTGGRISAAGNIAGSSLIANGAISGASIQLTGNVISGANVVGNYFVGNGSFLTGIAASYSNSNVAAYLPTYSGALTAANVSATGNITGNYFIGNGSALTGISAGALATRTTANIYTGSLAANANANVTVVGFKTYALYSIQTSAAAWVTVYSSNAARTADASRLITTDPTPGSGVIAEVINTGANTTYLSPGVIGYSSEAVPDSNIQLKVSNTGNVSANITVTLTLLKLES